MNQCYNSGDFKKYFIENMIALGAPVPNGLFDTYQKAIGTAATLASKRNLTKLRLTNSSWFLCNNEDIGIDSIVKHDYT